ncbi:GTPase ObgE [Mechercharimyces sp. CAU 1602]|uniref:GTPase ObgE n=1 Tax=Mechercharimyces sp. CAU 1602 TaxID=2973933 RepID=UPI00216147A1|nr:GTPase ObgE [Mechercharimyces sp. CAU 1602]MCS1351426.1 GTPase ObgE [Mechercharimyces sp. CAU 1602]
MFVDKVKVFVRAGSGGNGMVGFRREKYVPNGGPAGGDGGRGADVIFRVEEGLRTLMDFRYQKHFKAAHGEHGRGKSQHGKGAEPLVVLVPPGTVVRDAETGEKVADLTKQGEQRVVARGGKGGRGNIHFATPSNPAPEISENGEPGQERWLELELKLLADIGLVGYPSVGKSTLLAAVSAAKPKIGAYHFTTLAPNLGVVEVEDGRSFVMADLPGLIEGAHEGIGLGHQFLRHVERTRVIIHVIDMSGMEGRDPFEDYEQINKELRLYNEKLAQRPQIIAANKMDLPDAEDQLELFREQIGEDVSIIPISSATRQGLRELLYRAADLLDQAPQIELEEEGVDHKLYQTRPDEDDSFTIHRDNEVYVVEGEKVERLLLRTNFHYYDAQLRFARILKSMGVDDALREKGAQEGDTVRIGEMEFEFYS